MENAIRRILQITRAHWLGPLAVPNSELIWEFYGDAGFELNCQGATHSSPDRLADRRYTASNSTAITHIAALRPGP